MGIDLGYLLLGYIYKLLIYNIYLNRIMKSKLIKKIFILGNGIKDLLIQISVLKNPLNYFKFYLWFIIHEMGGSVALRTGMSYIPIVIFLAIKYIWG